MTSHAKQELSQKTNLDLISFDLYAGNSYTNVQYTAIKGNNHLEPTEVFYQGLVSVVNTHGKCH